MAACLKTVWGAVLYRNVVTTWLLEGSLKASRFTMLVNQYILELALNVTSYIWGLILFISSLKIVV